jgi:hypothetical protein
MMISLMLREGLLYYDGRPAYEGVILSLLQFIAFNILIVERV